MSDMPKEIYLYEVAPDCQSLCWTKDGTKGQTTYILKSHHTAEIERLQAEVERLRENVSDLRMCVKNVPIMINASINSNYGRRHYVCGADADRIKEICNNVLALTQAQGGE